VKISNKKRLKKIEKTKRPESHLDSVIVYDPRLPLPEDLESSGETVRIFIPDNGRDHYPSS
jgi:hypothetical protein